jgi:uncharacterized membrane protein
MGTLTVWEFGSWEGANKVRETFRATGLRAQLIESSLSDEQEAVIRELFGD